MSVSSANMTGWKHFSYLLYYCTKTQLIILIDKKIAGLNFIYHPRPWIISDFFKFHKTNHPPNLWRFIFQYLAWATRIRCTHQIRTHANSTCWELTIHHVMFIKWTVCYSARPTNLEYGWVCAKKWPEMSHIFGPLNLLEEPTSSLVSSFDGSPTKLVVASSNNQPPWQRDMPCFYTYYEERIDHALFDLLLLNYRQKEVEIHVSTTAVHRTEPSQ